MHLFWVKYYIYIEDFEISSGKEDFLKQDKKSKFPQGELQFRVVWLETNTYSKFMLVTGH